MRRRNLITILLAVIALLIAGLACGSSETDSDKQVRTLVEDSAEVDVGEDVSEPEETESIPPTDKPEPTLIPEIEGLVKEGTHLVGTDIEPGIYVGLAGEGLLSSCYWARLSNLTGTDDILANDNAEGLYYLEVLETDRALETACELLPIDQVPPPETFPTFVSVGTYLIGRDIEAGLYRGTAGDDLMESCYWARLKNVNGDNDILANDNATGQFFVEVLPTDFAVKFGCEVEKVE